MFKYKFKKNILLLYGSLNFNTVFILWKNKKNIIKNIDIIDLSKVSKIDSSGISIILYFFFSKKKNKKKLYLLGINKKIKSFIKLYKLDYIMFK